MTRTARLLFGVVLALALAAPTLLEAQARGRGTPGQQPAPGSSRPKGGLVPGHGGPQGRGIGRAGRMGRMGRMGRIGRGGLRGPTRRSPVERPGQVEIGSLRLKVTPNTAQVYVDGEFVGTADEFDGLSDHLKLADGRHKLELRAEGHETYVGQITVDAGKTLTERVTLKKKTR